MNVFKTLFSSFLAIKSRWFFVTLLILAIYFHYKYLAKDSKKNENNNKTLKNMKNCSSKPTQAQHNEVDDNSITCGRKSVPALTHDNKDCNIDKSDNFNSNRNEGSNNISTCDKKYILLKNDIEVENNKIFNDISKTNDRHVKIGSNGNTPYNYSLLNPSSLPNRLTNTSQMSGLLTLSKLQASKIHSIMKNNNYDNNDKVHQLCTKDINYFKVITLNILADSFCHTSRYKHCSKKYLKWNYRFEHIIEYLTKASCELIALQEVDRFFDIEKYYNDNTGYKTYYMKRAIDKPDGLMLIWSKEYFQSYSCSFKDICCEIRLNELADACFSKTLRNYYHQDNIACYAMLQSKHDLSHLIIFVNCHLYNHPQEHDIQLTQMCYILNIIYNHAQKIMNADRTIKNILLILCGDFNFSPTSSCYCYLTHGEYIVKGCFNNDNDNNELKLIMDPTLTKLAELCRNLGIDTTFFQDNDGYFNINHGKNAKKRNRNKQKLFNTENVFNKAKHESRYLITKSKSLISAQNSPPHLLLRSKDATENLREIIKHFDLSIEENCLYVRCEKCNVKYVEVNSNEAVEHTIQNNSEQECDRIKPTTIVYQCLECKKIVPREMKKLQNEELLNSLINHKKSDDEFNKQMLINKLTDERYNSLPPNLQTYSCWKNISFKNPFFQNSCLKAVTFECNITSNNHFNPISLDLIKYEKPMPIFNLIADSTTLSPASASVAVSSLGSNTSSPALSSISTSSSILSSSILTPNYMFYCNISNQNNITVGDLANCHNKKQKNKNNAVTYMACQIGGVDYSVFDNDDNSSDNMTENESELDIGSENDCNSRHECNPTGNNRLVPNKYWSSDHLPTYAVFMLYFNK